MSKKEKSNYILRRVGIQTEHFKKNVGIVFLENINNQDEWSPNLNFEQDACSYFLLQMNPVQDIFDFQIVTPFFDEYYTQDQFKKEFSVPVVTSYHKKSAAERRKLENWFNKIIGTIQKYSKAMDIDYWMFITSEQLSLNWNFCNNDSKTAWLITSHAWQRSYSPPSLFEYLAITIFTCSLYALALEFDRKDHNSHYSSTKGCIFDFTRHKPFRRILVSNPQICMDCLNHFNHIQQTIVVQTQKQVDLVSSIERVLDSGWIGTKENKNSPHFILKKNYGFDLNENSGFNKTLKEKIRDFIMEHQILSLIVTVIGTVLAVAGIIS